MRTYAATWRLPLEELARRFVDGGECARRGNQAEADRAFIAILHATARKVGAHCIECGGDVSEHIAARRHKAGCSRAPRKAAA